MRKRVLLAEESEATRKAAEAVLRENGFEVIAVVSGGKASEVIEFSTPDLIVIGSDLTGKGRKLFYQQLQENPKTESVPMLMFADPGQADLPFSAEALIERPLDPKAFIEKVNALVGQSADKQPAAAGGSSNPLTNVDLEDEFLDAALGLDRIDVMESEVMDKTQITAKKQKTKPSNKSDGYEAADESGDSGKVESLLIREDDTDIRPQGDLGDRPKKMSASGKIEIVNDQYGLVDNEAIQLDNEHATHDYHWFINEMQKDDSSYAPPGAENKTSDTSPPPDLTFSENSSIVDPVTPPPPPRPEEDQHSESPGVDQFIDEFKKEIKKIRSDEPESVTINEDQTGKSDSTEGLSWQDTLEKMSPEEVRLFTRQFVSALADRVAQLIAAKIDSDKLTQMLRREIMARLEKKHESSD